MPFTRSLILFAVLTTVLAAHPAGASDPTVTEEPFSLAEVIPADVDLFLHVEDAAGLRRWLDGRPLGGWVQATLGGGDVEAVWKRIAASLDTDATLLLDRVLGRRATLVTRRDGKAALDGGPDWEGVLPVSWALLLEMDERDFTGLRSGLRAKIEGLPGATIAYVPEHELLLARREGWTVVAPKERAGLFEDILDGFDGRGPAATLAGTDACRRGRALGPARVAVMQRHDLPLGGWTVASATVDGEEVRVAHASRFKSSPFQRRITERETEFGPIEALEETTLLTIVEPTDIGDGFVGQFLMANLELPLTSREMLDRLGARRVFTVGEHEGRLMEQPVDLLSTTVGVCIEIDQRHEMAGAVQAIDDQMQRIACRINDLGEGAFLIDYHVKHPIGLEQPRRIALTPATEWLTGGWPIMRNIDLTWTVVDGAQGKWYVIATHGTHLDDVTKALSQPAGDDALVGVYDAAGSFDGVRIGKHLRSWAEKPELFMDEAADAEVVADFGAWLEHVASFAEGIDGARWTMRRPSANELEVTVRMRTSKAHSADFAPEPGRAGGAPGQVPCRRRCDDGS